MIPVKVAPRPPKRHPAIPVVAFSPPYKAAQATRTKQAPQSTTATQPPPVGSTTASRTAHATAFGAAMMARFPGSYPVGVCSCRGTRGPGHNETCPGSDCCWSEHAWCNAIDVGHPSLETRQRMAAWASSAAVRQQWGVAASYDEGAGYSHVHTEFLPTHDCSTVPPCAGGGSPAGGTEWVGGTVAIQQYCADELHRPNDPTCVAESRAACLQQGITNARPCVACMKNGFSTPECQVFGDPGFANPLGPDLGLIGGALKVCGEGGWGGFICKIPIYLTIAAGGFVLLVGAAFLVMGTTGSTPKQVRGILTERGRLIETGRRRESRDAEREFNAAERRGDVPDEGETETRYDATRGRRRRKGEFTREDVA